MSHVVLMADDSSDESDSNDGSSSSSSSEPHKTLLLDDEAIESGGSNDEAADGVSSSSGTIEQDGSLPSKFGEFLKLPPELRRRIWEIFCPDLICTSRVLTFDVSNSISLAYRTLLDHDPGHMYTVSDGLSLRDQTLHFRRMLAVHRESRHIALQSAPDVLPLQAGSGDALVRFNKERDIVMMNHLPEGTSSVLFLISKFLQDVEQLAVEEVGGSYHALDELLINSYQDCKSLKRLFVCYPADGIKTKRLRWCVSDNSHHYMLETFESQHGGGEDFQRMLCWPNATEHPDFTKYSVSPIMRSFMHDYEEGTVGNGVAVYPMIDFWEGISMKQYESMVEQKDTPYHDEDMSDRPSSATGDSGSEAASESDENDYESEGIDDSEVIERDSSSEDELIPDAISVGGSSPGTGSPGVTANFSSPEPEDEDASARGGDRFNGKRRKRNIISDSDEDVSDEEPAPKRPRTTRRTLVDSDDENDDDDAIRPPGIIPIPEATKRGIDSDSGSDSSSSSDNKTRIRKSSRSTTTTDSSSSVEENDNDQVKRRLTLAERLQHPSRRQSGFTSDEIDSEENDGADASDDEGDDDDDSDDDESENGLIDNMAADSDEVDESDDEGW